MAEFSDAVLLLSGASEPPDGSDEFRGLVTRMLGAVELLEAAFPATDPGAMFDVVDEALGHAVGLLSLDDAQSSSAIDVCTRLLELHPTVAEAARVPVAELIDWMVEFQFNDEIGIFALDVVAYAPALGDIGLRRYRDRLTALEPELLHRPDAVSAPEWRKNFAYARHRFGVLDRDEDAIMGNLDGDRTVAQQWRNVAEAYDTLGEVGLAIDWAKRAVASDADSRDARSAADYWCELLEEHHPDQVLTARRWVFERWPSHSSAAALHRSAGSYWPSLRDEVVDALARADAGGAVLFVLRTLRDVRGAWELAHERDLPMAWIEVWSDLVGEFERLDPLATLPVQRAIVESDLALTAVRFYRRGAARLAHMRELAAGTGEEERVEAWIGEFRAKYPRRPRLQVEFDAAGLP